MDALRTLQTNRNDRLSLQVQTRLWVWLRTRLGSFSEHGDEDSVMTLSAGSMKVPYNRSMGWDHDIVLNLCSRVDDCLTELGMSENPELFSAYELHFTKDRQHIATLMNLRLDTNVKTVSVRWSSHYVHCFQREGIGGCEALSGGRSRIA